MYLATGQALSIDILLDYGQFYKCKLSVAVFDCGGLSDPVNGAVSAPITTFDATATYSCDIGHDPVGDTTRQCMADGTWSGAAPTCPSKQVKTHTI